MRSRSNTPRAWSLQQGQLSEQGQAHHSVAHAWDRTARWPRRGWLLCIKPAASVDRIARFGEDVGRHLKHQLRGSSRRAESAVAVGGKLTLHQPLNLKCRALRLGVSSWRSLRARGWCAIHRSGVLRGSRPLPRKGNRVLERVETVFPGYSTPEGAITQSRRRQSAES